MSVVASSREKTRRFLQCCDTLRFLLRVRTVASMKIIIVLVVIISLVSGIQYDGLRVKFAASDALVDVENFFHIPRTIVQAEDEGWQRVDRDDDYLPQLRLYCIMQSKGLCALYDVGGFVAGLQISLPKDQYVSAPNVTPEQWFQSWTVSANDNDGENSREYWTITQYFVSEESLKAGAPTLENGRTLQHGGVWVRDQDKKMMKIPALEADLPKVFLKQNCMKNMGVHYYYNMTHDQQCEDYYPFFTLASEGQLIGVGFQYFGQLPVQPYREWLEPIPDPEPFIKAIIPDSPPCVLEWSKAYDVLSLHIYYVDKPWQIQCKDGGSVMPSSPSSTGDRFAVSVARYASAISDEVKKFLWG